MAVGVNNLFLGAGARRAMRDSAPNSTPTQETFSGLLNRSIQLNALSYFVIAALMALTGVLGFMVVNSIEPPSGWLFGRESFQLLALSLVSATVFLLLERQAKLRKRLQDALTDVCLARESAEHYATSLMAAHHAAEIMVEITEDDALYRMIERVRDDLGVMGAAIIMDDTIRSFASDAPEDEATEIFGRLAIEVVRTGTPIGCFKGEEGSALAFPLHVLGRLRGVLCLWQDLGHALPGLDGVALLARVVELGWEARLLYDGAGSHARSLSQVLVALVEERLPGYSLATDQITMLVERAAARSGLSQDVVEDMKLAARLRDVGLLTVPAFEPVDDGHADAGATLLGRAGFPDQVEEAVRYHHPEQGPSSVSRVCSAAKILGACVELAEKTAPVPLSLIRDGAQTQAVCYPSSAQEMATDAWAGWETNRYTA